MSVGSISLDGALSIASSGIANISAQLALVSHNVANASTPDYAVEIGNQQSVSAGGIGMGVATDPATRATDAALQASLLGQNAAVSGLQTQQTAMQAIASVQGTPGQGQDLASMLGNLQDAFSTLLTDPSNAAQQSAVVSAAGTLARGINTLSNAYTQQRQAAQDAIVSGVKTINTSLGAIGQLSDQIVAAKAAGQSTADLENQRDAQISSLSQLLDVKVLPQSNGDVLITTSTGTVLPTHTSGPAQHGRRQCAAGFVLFGWNHTADHDGRDGRYRRAARRRDRRQPHLTRSDPAHLSGRVGRVRAKPCLAFQRAGPDPVYRW